MSVAGSVRDLLDFFLPSACVGCGERLALERSPELVCPRCTTRLRPLPGPACERCGHPLGTGGRDRACLECAEWPGLLARVRSALILEPPTDRIVHALKYGGWRELAPFMAARMVRLRGWGSPGPEPPLVVPVPTTPGRERYRGYNQSELLARAFARRAGIEAVNALERQGKGGTQVSLHPAERLANVRGAFSVRRSAVSRLRASHVVVVDDVFTTGATVRAVARSLQEAGVGSMAAVTFARALPYRSRPR